MKFLFLIYLIPFLIVGILSIQVYGQIEIEDNEIIPHRDLAISYTVGRDGTLTAIVNDDSFSIEIPQIANQFWLSVEKTIVDENITTIEFIKGANTVLLTLNLTENILHFDLSGRLIDENLLIFKFSENTKRLGENRTGLRLENGNEFYFDWKDINLRNEYIEGSKSLRVDIRSAPNFKLDPRISITNPDWETGDFTGWTTASGSDCSQSISSVTPINGSESHLINSQVGSDNNCSAIQDIGPNTDSHLQAQFRIESGYTIDGARKGIVGWRGGGGSTAGLFFVIFNSSSSQLEVLGRYAVDSGNVDVRNASFTGIAVGNLYCIEIRYFRSSSPNDGEFQVWINNTQALSASNFDNNGINRADRIVSGQQNDQGFADIIFRTDDFYADDSERVNTCPEGLSPPVPPPIPIIVVDFFPLAPLMNLFFIVGGFILVFNAKGRLEFQATGMFFFLASLLFISIPIYAIIDDTSSLSYVVLNYPDGIRNNFVLINFVFIGLGLTSVIMNNKGRLGFR